MTASFGQPVPGPMQPRPAITPLGAMGPAATQQRAPLGMPAPIPGANPMANIDPKQIAEAMRKLMGTPQTPYPQPGVPHGAPGALTPDNTPAAAMAPGADATMNAAMGMEGSMGGGSLAPSAASSAAAAGAPNAGFMEWLKQQAPGLFGAGGVAPTMGVPGGLGG